MRVAATLHWISTVLLAAGFLGAFLFVADVSWWSHDGDADIGLALLVLFCLVVGVGGLVLAGVALVVGLLARRRGALR
jgi:hypothetical protein